MSCNGNCNQGRTCDCAQKLKIDWNSVGFAITFIATIVYIVVFFNYIWTMDKTTIRYDCRVAEIAVDYPAKVKEDCRKKLNGRS